MEPPVSRWITAWSAEPSEAANLLECVFKRIAEETAVLFIALGVESAADPSEWMPRFKGLSPRLLQNALGSTADRMARLALRRFPLPGVLKEFAPMLKRTFAWIVTVSSAEWSPEAVAWLEQSD